MSLNLLLDFEAHLFTYITGTKITETSKKCNLIKQNKDKLNVNGDFSFPNKKSLWMPYMPNTGFCYSDQCKHHTHNFLFIDDENADADFVGTEIKEEIPFHSHYTITKLQNSFSACSTVALCVASIKIVGEWCNVFLDRKKCIDKVIKNTLLHNNKESVKTKKEGQVKPIKVTSDYVFSDNISCSVTDYRLSLLESVIKNLINVSDKYELLQEEENTKNENTTHVHLTTKSSRIVACHTRKIMSGIVTDPSKGNKLANVTSEDYIKKRSTDMQLMAQHKYGLRVKNEAVFIELIKQLGFAAVTVDFMEVRHSSPVALNLSGCSTSKGASFILYNSARIETILRKFNEKVESGYYNPLPDLSDMDISQLLIEEEEWQILIVYVAGYENLIEKSLADIESGKIAPHLVCCYLCGLVGLFSVYYRRCRILIENRSQLLPQIYARIYLLKCIQRVLNNALALLNIDPVTQM